MSTKIRVSSDVTGADIEIQGSDGRMNVSSRSDSRGYYNSRDQQHAYALSFLMTLADTDEDFVAWRNASPSLDLVISGVEISAFEPVDIKWHVGTGTPAAGTTIVPGNMNKGSSRAAPTDSAVSAMEGNASTPLTGLTSTAVVGYRSIGVAQTAVVFNFDDRVRLGQDDTFFGELEAASTPGFVLGTIFGYYE